MLKLNAYQINIGTHLFFGGDVMTEFEDNVIDGVVEEIIYENEDTGYRVFSVNCDGILTTAVATCPQLFAGETITASGEWKNHSAYGRQFVCDEIEKTFPYELDGMLKFLASGAVKGVGPSTAQKIIDKFKEDSFYVIENEPMRLVEIAGITVSKAESISKEFQPAGEPSSSKAFREGAPYRLSQRFALPRLYLYQC